MEKTQMNSSISMMAEGLKRSSERQDITQSPIFNEVLAHLGHERTVLDIGAGVGRFTAPLAKAGCKLVAIEPNEEMLGYLTEALAKHEVKENVQIIQSTWPIESSLQTEVALSAFVIQFSSDWVAFAKAMEQSATKRCILAVHVDPMMGFIQQLWPMFHPNLPAPHMPLFTEIYPALIQAGILADVHIHQEEQAPRWSTAREALPMIGARLEIADNADALVKLEALLQDPALGLFQPRKHRFAVLSWTPQES